MKQILVHRLAKPQWNLKTRLLKKRQVKIVGFPSAKLHFLSLIRHQKSKENLSLILMMMWHRLALKVWSWIMPQTQMVTTGLAAQERRTERVGAITARAKVPLEKLAQWIARSVVERIENVLPDAYPPNRATNAWHFSPTNHGIASGIRQFVLWTSFLEPIHSSIFLLHHYLGQLQGLPTNSLEQNLAEYPSQMASLRMTLEP